jgi:cell division protein FtsL
MTEPSTVPRPSRRTRPAPEATGRPRPARQAPSRARPAPEGSRRSRPARETAGSSRPAAGSARPARDAVNSALLARQVSGVQPASIPARARPSAARAAAAAHLARATGGAGSIHALPLEHRRRIPGLRHLWVVPAPSRSPAQRGRRRRVLLLSGVGLMIAVAFGLVYLHVVLAQRQFALDRLTAKVQADSATYQKLRLQVAELGSPQHVISMAEGQLGMRPPASVTYLTPTVTVPGEATAAGPSAALGSTGQAPAGDADWPQIKSQLAGSP